MAYDRPPTDPANTLTQATTSVRRLAARTAIAVCAAAMLPLPAPALAQTVRAEPAGPVTTGRFELRSDPRVGLHHFLLDWAAADAGQWPPYAQPIVERDEGLDELEPAERSTWRAAVEAYGAAVDRSLLFDEGLLAVRDWAAGTGSQEAVPDEDRPLVEALEAALPVYETRWWPAHDAQNRAWIGAVAPALEEMEEEIVPRLEAAYGGRWPADRIPIDVVAYANPVGAYSTAGRVTVASGDPDARMPQSVEIVFHESSHVDPLEVPLREALARAYGKAGAEPPDRLWHDVIFVTTGEVTRLVFAGHGRPGYRHYGETSGVYARGPRWAPELAAFERHWLPFLRSGSTDAGERDAALEAVAAELVSNPG